MRTRKFTFLILALALLRGSLCEAGIFVATNSYFDYSPTQISELQLTGALAADGGSGTIVGVLSDGVVSNFFPYSGQGYPPSGLSNVTAI